jgi:hypothetical protein
MPMGCPERQTVHDLHSQRPNIDLAIERGIKPPADCGAVQGLGPTPAWRHGREHLTPEIRAALATKVLAREGDMRRILLKEGTGDAKAATAISGRLHESLSLTAKLTGELVPHTGVSIVNVPAVTGLHAAAGRTAARFGAVPRGAGGGCGSVPAGGAAGGHGDGSAGVEVDRGAAAACRLTPCSILPTGSTRRCSTASGFRRDPRQSPVLRSRARWILLNCCRQSGKSTTTALTKKIGLPSVLPVRIQVRCVYHKIATRLRWDGAESRGFVGRVADPEQPPPKRAVVLSSSCASIDEPRRATPPRRLHKEITS